MALHGSRPSALPSVPAARVTITEVDYGTAEEPDPSWHLTFSFQSPGISASFTAKEPDLHTFSDWLALSEGRRAIRCYRGNGDGYITLRDDCFVFRAAPSGAGEDVTAEIVVPVAIVGPKLAAALRDAENQGLAFAKPKLEEIS